MEVQGNASIGKLLYNFRIKAAPGLSGNDFLLQLLYLFQGFRVEHEGAAGKPDQVFLLHGNHFRSFRDVYLPESLDESVHQVQFGRYLLGGVVNRFYAAGDVHQAQLLQLFHQCFLLPVKEHEGIFGHAGNHGWEASSSSA